MVSCKNCFQDYDEIMADGVCPYCGHVMSNNPLPGMLLSYTEKEEDPRYLPLGTVLHGRYEVRNVIGAGGFGITYKVFDRESDTEKAIKEYFQQGVVNRIPGTTEVLISAPKRKEEFEYGRMRLLREAQIVAKFQSKSIVRVHDFFEENNTSYMVMEYIDASTLEQYILSQKKLMTPMEAVKVGVSICDALSEIHEAGVIHRDIAPDNIFILPSGDVKIIDFGSARLSREDTGNHLIVLKPGYAPPEQYEKIDVRNDLQNTWTDVYSLGATLYAALTGRTPAESTDRKVDYLKNTDRLCYPKEINQSIPEFLNNSIMTAMAINIHERFQSAERFKQALLQEKKIRPVEVVRKRKKIRRTAGVGSGLILIAVLVMAGIGWFDVKKDDAVLAPAQVSVWYSVSENEELKSMKIAAMEAIYKELEASDKFSEVAIDLRPIDEDEYIEALQSASEKHEMPHLFEAVATSEELSDDLIDLSGLLHELNDEAFYFIEEYEDSHKETDEIPTGFNIPVIYVNTILVPDYEEGASIQSMEDFLNLCNGDMEYKPVAVSQNAEAKYETIFSDFSIDDLTVAQNGISDFVEGKAVACFGDSSDYCKIRNTLQGYFKMVPISSDNLACDFANYWSVSKSGENEELAAKALLEYMLSNYAQDRYYLQTNLPGLPLEKGALQAYPEIHRPFEEFLENLSSYSFDNLG